MDPQIRDANCDIIICWIIRLMFEVMQSILIAAQEGCISEMVTLVLSVITG